MPTIEEQQNQITALKETLGALLAWMAQSSSQIGRPEALALLKKLDAAFEAKR
jgi:hypothetical protein